jgi:hypothetical protein
MTQAIIDHMRLRCEVCKHTLFTDLEDNGDLSIRCINPICANLNTRFKMPDVVLVPYTGGGSGKFTPTQRDLNSFKSDRLVP